MASYIKKGIEPIQKEGINGFPKTRELYEKFSNFSAETLHKVDGALEHAHLQANEYRHSLETYVKKNPLKSVGIAIATGVLLAKLFRR